MGTQNKNGFTLVEVMMVIALISVLAVLVYSLIIPRWRERTYYSRTLSEVNTMANALNLYVVKYNDYPADESRNIPAGIKEFVQSQEGNGSWPSAPYPGSVYDYDNWPPGPNGDEQTYQISVRFCDVGQDSVCKSLAQKYLKDHVSANVLENWDSRSSMYYCIKGACRSHEEVTVDHPGYCLNCGNKNSIF